MLETLARHGKMDEALAEKAEAVRIWERIVGLAEKIKWPPGREGDYVRVSSAYGLLLFRIVHHGWRVMIEGLRDNEPALSDAIQCHDQAWIDYRNLAACPAVCELVSWRVFQPSGNAFLNRIA